MDVTSRVQLQNALKSLSVDRTDEDAWRILYDQTRSTAVAAAKRVLRDQAELADDVAQEAFLRIFRYCKFEDLPDNDAFLAYLRAVCRNAARDMLKDLAAESGIENAEDGELEAIRVSAETPEDLAIAQETLIDFMNQLDEADREMLRLSMEGYDQAEIADRLALSYRNAGVRLHRTRERLRNYLKMRRKISDRVCKKLGKNEVLYSEQMGVKRHPDSLVWIRGTKGRNQPVIPKIQQSEPESLVAQSPIHSINSHQVS
jgi:RNA polymerase sigma factor (sigma-70 family)